MSLAGLSTLSTWSTLPGYQANLPEPFRASVWDKVLPPVRLLSEVVTQAFRLLKRDRNTDQLPRQLCWTMERGGSGLDGTSGGALAVLLGYALINVGGPGLVRSRPASRDAGGVAWGEGRRRGHQHW